MASLTRKEEDAVERAPFYMKGSKEKAKEGSKTLLVNQRPLKLVYGVYPLYLHSNENYCAQQMYSDEACKESKCCHCGPPAPQPWSLTHP